MEKFGRGQIQRGILSIALGVCLLQQGSCAFDVRTTVLTGIEDLSRSLVDVLITNLFERLENEESGETARPSG